MEVVLVAAFGAAGSLARYGLNRALPPFRADAFPLATFVANITGAFLLGFLATYLLERTGVAQELRVGIAVGFLGAYTTFSTFSLETVAMLRTGHWGLALGYVTLTLALTLSGAWAGQEAARL